jgi:hypothetical protein
MHITFVAFNCYVVTSWPCNTHDDNAVPGCDGEDVSAGHDVGLDGVHDLEASDGAVVGIRHLLALEARRPAAATRHIPASNSDASHPCEQQSVGIIRLAHKTSH